MKHIISSRNWRTELANIIKKSKDGDIIIIATEAQYELAIRAQQRMCPQKQISFIIQKSVDKVVYGN